MAAVIGDPVAHSLSPLIHNAAFSAVGLDWVYVAFKVAAGRAGEALEAVRLLDLGGLSVTMPHKDAVAAAVDALAPEAARLGAVNCVTRQGARLVGHNTDGAGFVASLRERAAWDPVGKRCVVLGAGGAARAVIAALADAGAREVVVVNRTAGTAAAAVAVAPGVARVGTVDQTGEADLVVNATPVGMGAPAADGPRPLPADRLGPGQVAADLVYDPVRTGWLTDAAARGAVTVTGLGMLVHQAALAFELWTGETAPVSAMHAAVAATLDVDPG